MRVVVSGSSGFIGSALVEALESKGHEALRLIRSPVFNQRNEIRWNPEDGTLGPGDLSGLNGVIHLAGENIGSGRWTKRRMAKIMDSRTGGTSLLARTLASLPGVPEVLICASAVGYYGNCGNRELDEDGSQGSGFLAEVVREWEAATRPAVEAGIRVVCLRFGMVLSPEGGVLARLLPLFHLGLGGPVGSGRQYMSWIMLEDVIGVIFHVLNTGELSGAVNVTAPNPVTNREFARILGHVLRRPAIIPVPAPVIKLVFGRMGKELLLFGQRAIPRKLTDSGYKFKYPELRRAPLVVRQK